MNLIAVGGSGSLGRYVGFYEPYATSHQALDADPRSTKEGRNTVTPDRDLLDLRPK